MRALQRLLRLLLRVAIGLWTIQWRFPRLSQPERDAAVQAWAHSMLACAGVELRVLGEVPQNGPVLLAANHISWLDILVMHAARHCRFVSKSDIEHWPLPGARSISPASRAEMPCGWCTAWPNVCARRTC